MQRAFAACLLVLFASGVLASCSDDNSSSSSGSSGGSGASSSTSTALCDSVDELQSSVAALTSVPVRSDGFSALEDALGQVQSDVTTVVKEGKAQFQPQTDALSTAASGLEKSVGQAVDAPSPATLSAVIDAVPALVDASTALARDVASSCGGGTSDATP